MDALFFTVLPFLLVATCLVLAIAFYRRSNPEGRPSWVITGAISLALAAGLFVAMMIALWRQVWWSVPLVGGLAGSALLFGLGAFRRRRHADS